MLRTVKELRQFAIEATDGAIGHVDDVYFDDVAWAVRYLVVDTGTWTPGTQVLISPISAGHPDWLAKKLPVALSVDRVKKSPAIDTHRPVSRLYESELSTYYGYPTYWGETGLWGMGGYPGFLTTADAAQAEIARAGRTSDPAANADSHLRSCAAVTGYHIRATDGEIGHVEDFLVDEQTWAIRYLVVNTSNWWLGHTVLVSPAWIADVSWPDNTVSVHVSRKAIQDAPPYDPASGIDRELEARVYEHYRQSGAWVGEAEQTSKAG